MYLKPQDVLKEIEKEIERIETSLNKVKRRARSQGIIVPKSPDPTLP